VFYPYLFIYLASVVIPENTDIDTHPLKILCLIAVALLIAVAAILLLMKIYRKNKAIPFISSVLCFIVGLLILSSTKNIMGIIIGLTPGIIGYAIIMIQFGATVRDNTPKDKIGLFQGIKTIFLLFIPKFIGPTLGNIASTNSSVTYMDNGSEKVLPTEAMFLYAAIVAALIFIPMLAFLKKDKERALKEENE
jgi:MFS family permease